jgi:hypothetical protein
MLSGEKNICLRGRCRLRGTKVLAEDDQGRLCGYDRATIVGGDAAARRCGGAG